MNLIIVALKYYEIEMLIQTNDSTVDFVRSSIPFYHMEMRYNYVYRLGQLVWLYDMNKSTLSKSCE